ncbi:glutamate receptor ionotropic, delta-2-like [Sipha flava]|nr:glutamate receptor ionotropic, delta-2-like [Sipha flava]
MILYRGKEDFNNDFNLKKVLSLSLYSPLLGVIVDWSCNEDLSFEFSDNWLWNSSYHWLMIMEKNSNKNIRSFLSTKNINLTVWSEVFLAYPNNTMYGIFKNWHIFDIYRTAYEPRGQLMIDVVNETFGKWGNRICKYDKRSNLENLTLDVVTIGNAYGSATKTNSTSITASNKELVKYLRTYNLDRMNYGQKFSYAIMYSLTRNVLNLTMYIKTTNSWGYKTNNKWDGVIGMLISGEADFSVILNAIRPERLEVVEYSAITTWEHCPSFIFRQPRSSSTSMNIFLRPFEMNVWFAIIGLMLLSTLVYYTIIYFESNEVFILKTLSDIFLLKIGTLCQQGTVMELTKLSNRFIVLLMFLFSLIVYQFYSSSIVSGLLRPTIINIDSLRELDESGLDVGIEDYNIVTKLANMAAETNPYMKKIIDKKVKPKSEYLFAKDGVKKVKKGHYAFYTDPASSYWFVNDIFTEKEKCDLSELPITRPEVTGFLVQKNSPYRKLINIAGNLLLETGIMDRELQIWYAKKPKCVAGKTTTEESLVSVGIKDIISLYIFLLVGFIVSIITLLLEKIIHHLINIKKQTDTNRSIVLQK